MTLASNTGTADALTVNVVDTDRLTDTTTLTAAGIEVLTLDVGTTTGETHKLSLTGVAATSLSNQTINIVDGLAATGLTIVDVDTTTNVIDASTFVGDLTLSDRASTVTTITTGSGTDSVPTEHVNDVIDMGTGADTLTVSYTAIGKAIDVDMSVAAGLDMITIGGAVGTSQSNFESVDLASYVGTGSNVVGSTGVNTITGSPKTDAINPGLGADIILTSMGIDYITVTETTASADILELGSSVDANNYNQITGFDFGGTATDDNIRALDTVFGFLGDGNANNAAVVVATGANLDAANTAKGANTSTVYTITDDVATHTFAKFMSGASTYAQLEGSVSTAIGAATDGDFDANTNVLIAVDDGVDTGIFYANSAANAQTVSAAEIELIGILKGVTNAATLVAADFVFA